MANDAFGRLRKLQAEAQAAFDETSLGRRAEHQISGLQRCLYFGLLVGRSFVRNRCPLRASGLAYGSLLAMVPMLAVVISVSASLLQRQGEEPIQRFIDTLVERLTPEAGPEFAGPPPPPGWVPSASTTGPRPGPTPDRLEPPDAAAVAPSDAAPSPLFDPVEYAKTRREIALQIKEFVGNIRSGTLGATGMVALLFVAIAMLTRIEDTFNDIWGVTRGRTWFARIVQYWGAITLGPILLAVTFTLTSGPYLEATRNFLASLGPAGAWALKMSLAVLPYVIWSLAFSLFYQLMPHTKVRWSAALVGGLCGGCLWQLNSQFSVLYISRVVTNSQIYGSLAMIPVFMIGLYFAWLILLFGAQVSYAFQNRRSYLEDKQAEAAHQRSREFAALRLMTRIAWRFHRGERPPTLSELSDLVGVPGRLASQALHTLVDMNLIAEVANGDTAYIPSRPLHQITAHHVLQALRTGQGMTLLTRDDQARTLIQSEFDRILEAERQAAETVTLQDLVNRLSAAEPAPPTPDAAAAATGPAQPRPAPAPQPSPQPKR